MKKSGTQCNGAKTVVRITADEMSYDGWNVIPPQYVTCPECAHSIKPQQRCWIDKNTGNWSVIVGKHMVKA